MLARPLSRAQALKKHLVPVKQCFRLYTLLGTFDDNPSDISMTQWRRAIAELRMDKPPYEAAAIDDIFVRANRSAEEARVLEQRKEAASAKGRSGGEEEGAAADGAALAAQPSSAGEEEVDADGGRADRLLQHEFVGALLRLGALRAQTLRSKASKYKSLAMALDELVVEHLVPYSCAKDELAPVLAERNVRWVLDKWRDKMAPAYATCAAERRDACTDPGASGAPGAPLTSLHRVRCAGTRRPTRATRPMPRGASSGARPRSP